MKNIELWFEIQQFLFEEARLQDERRFEEWLDLFTDDLVYWMPIRSNRVAKEMSKEISEYGQLAYYDDNKESLANRVARLHTGMAWAETPPSRTRHIVNNVQIEAGDRDDELKVRSVLTVYRSHFEHDENWFVGSRDDTLRKVDGKWKIAKRTVILDQVILSTKNLAFFF